MDTPLVWRRSQRCASGECVEVASVAAGVAMRDSTRPTGTVLRFTASDWATFMGDIRAGRMTTRPVEPLEDS